MRLPATTPHRFRLIFGDTAAPEANTRKDKLHRASCWICNRDVPLQSCKVDEHGRAVHEECYVARMKLEPGSSRVPTERHD